MGVQEEQGLPEERARPPAFSWSWRYRPAMSMRVAIGFAAVALTVIAANLITERSANSAREHVRHLLVQHEPLERATETLAFAVSQYERSSVGATQQESAAAAEVAASQTRTAEALDGYETAARRCPEGDFFIPELRSEIEAFTQSAARLLERDQARRSRLKEYWS